MGSFLKPGWEGGRGAPCAAADVQGRAEQLPVLQPGMQERLRDANPRDVLGPPSSAEIQNLRALGVPGSKSAMSKQNRSD